ncbi:hypothetical protein ATANTOWER_032220 [Ataeniobius toweri]|uniref:Uncharacterized protein n=1 Tax=Ataeniobius toweri TaxID=208326 RepID=A0ABU7A9Q2_9TELE|nr:hypothetical protein [Ataeniobius toweri]
MDEVVGQRSSTIPPVLIASIPEEIPGPSRAVGNQMEKEDSEPAGRGQKRNGRQLEVKCLAQGHINIWQEEAGWNQTHNLLIARRLLFLLNHSHHTKERGTDMRR